MATVTLPMAKSVARRWQPHQVTTARVGSRMQQGSRGQAATVCSRGRARHRRQSHASDRVPVVGGMQPRAGDRTGDNDRRGKIRVFL
ncbi:hypothetical protein BHE74_00058119 [Ensete ventricosum]|nr:hypothetical protein BHE74_00058119 [Ensete ventricosum]